MIDESGLGFLSDKDFDVMFLTIDLDGNGYVNFTEFTAFFASLPTAADNDSFVLEEAFIDDKEA